MSIHPIIQQALRGIAPPRERAANPHDRLHNCGNCMERARTIPCPKDIDESGRICHRCAEEWLRIEAADFLIRWDLKMDERGERAAKCVAQTALLYLLGE